MLKRYYLLFLMVFFLASCAHQESNKAPSSAEFMQHQSGKVVRSVKSFSQIEATGQVNITLHTGYKKPRVVLTGDLRDLAEVKTVVVYNTLHLVLGEGYPKFGPVHADIQGQYLTRFSFKGKGQINGSQLHTNYFELFIHNKGTTKLGGSIGLHRLDTKGSGVVEISGINSRDLQINVLSGNPKLLLSGAANLTNLALAGDAWLSMYWVKSDHLAIKAKEHAKIQLAGVVNVLEVDLWDRAHFKGRFLRAQRSFVKTRGHSTAEISSVNHQSTLATDASDIYYYNLPNTRQDFMAYDGSVLDMREWSRFELRDFDRYNHQYP